MKKLIIGLVMCLLCWIPVAGSSYQTPPPAGELQQYIQKYCKKNCVDEYSVLKYTVRAGDKHNIDFRILLAIIQVESKFFVKARNRSSVGLMQILLRYHKPKFKQKDYYLPEDNIRVGGQIFSDCYNKHRGNLKRSLRCYNGGGDPKYPEKVLKAYNELKLVSFV